MSLELAKAYFRLKKETPSESLLDKLRQLKQNFEKSSEEIRSMQYAFSSIRIDRQVKMDFLKAKIEAWLTYHDFKIDHCSKEMEITGEKEELRHEIRSLPYGVYVVRMIKPEDNYKLEARGHTMLYVHEKEMGLFFDNNRYLKKTSQQQRSEWLLRNLLKVHSEWDLPILRLYRIKPIQDK